MSPTSPIRHARIIAPLLASVLLTAVAALEAGVPRSDAGLSSQSAVSPTMHAFVHQDQTIGLTFDDGSSVGSQARTTPTIPAGTYTIRVIDDTAEHNFHLSGPGVDMATSTDNTASPTWTVTFQSGATYKYECDTHSDFMFGQFQASGSRLLRRLLRRLVGGGSSGGSSSGGSSSGGSSSGGTSVGTPASSLRGTLAGTVSSAGTLKLAFQGKAVAKLRAGRYKVTVVDKTPTGSFLLQESGHAALVVSGVSFVGTHSVTLNLKAGKWTF